MHFHPKILTPNPSPAFILKPIMHLNSIKYHTFKLVKRFHSNILIHSIDSQIALISTNSFIKPKSEEGTIIDPSNFDPGAELDKFWDHLRSQKAPKTNKVQDNQESLNGGRTETETPRNSGWPKMTQKEDNPKSRQRSRNCEGLACTA